MISFALLLDKEINNFKNVIKLSEKHFGVEPIVVNHSFANAIDKRNQLIFNINQNKIHFMIPDNELSSDYSNALLSIKQFISNDLKNQKVGIKFYNSKSEDFFNDVVEAKIIKLQ